MTKPRTTNPRFSVAYRKASLAERFNLSYTVNPESGCWEWHGFIAKVHGYGIICDKRKRLLAHRVSYELHKGPVTACVLHKCDNRKCVNPDHLFIGTRRVNNKDRNEKLRQAFGKRHGKYIHGKFVNQPRWRTRADGTRYFYSGNPEK